jgi:hypothetical protein
LYDPSACHARYATPAKCGELQFKQLYETMV